MHTCPTIAHYSREPVPVLRRAGALRPAHRSSGNEGLAATLRAALIGAILMRRWAGWARSVSCRVLALALVLGAPGVTDTLQQLAASNTGVGCESEGECAKGTLGGGSHACTPDSCAGCGCCVHARAWIGALQPLGLAAPAGEHARIHRSEPRRAPGYRAPPYRPPVS